MHKAEEIYEVAMLSSICVGCAGSRAGGSEEGFLLFRLCADVEESNNLFERE